MKFVVLCSTGDGRLTAGKVYTGTIVIRANELRVVVYDNRNEWMTFNPKVFKPAE